jgi:hypothetical protein
VTEADIKELEAAARLECTPRMRHKNKEEFS